VFTKDRGFVKLSVVLAVVFGIGFGASAYLNYAQHEASKQEQTQLQGQVTDLTYQLKQDGGPTTSPTPSANAAADPSPSPSPSTTPAVAGTASISISQFGVHFTVTDPVTDLTYSPEPSGAYTVAAFTTQSLLAKYPACKPGVLGSLVRKPTNAAKSANDTFIKALGGYDYYYVAAYGYCASDQSGRDTIVADRAAIQNGALPTLTQ
jgi:hypothetical protein